MLQSLHHLGTIHLQSMAIKFSGKPFVLAGHIGWESLTKKIPLSLAAIQAKWMAVMYRC